MSPSIDDLRESLRRYARKKGLSAEDAEDLAGDAWISAVTWGQRHEKPHQEVVRYGFKCLTNRMSDLWSTPEHVVAKRVAQVILAGQLECFECGSRSIVSLKNQRTLLPLEPSEEKALEERLSNFLYAQNGLEGTNPSGHSTRALSKRYLQWAGRPVSKDHLIAQIAGMVVIPRINFEFDEDFDLATEPTAYSDLFGAFWKSVTNMPYRMRASLLLALDCEQLGVGVEVESRELEKALPEWTPPPALETGQLPFEDDLIADKLGITKKNLHAIRSRALNLVRRALYAFHPQFSGEEAA